MREAPLHHIVPLFIQFIISIPLKLIMTIFVDLHADGLENLKNLPRDKGIIFAANHTSQLDALVIPLSLPALSRFLPVYFVSLEKAHYNGFQFPWRYLYGGMWFKLLGSYPAFRGLKNYERAMPYHIKLLEGRHALCIFPEGRRTRDGKLGEAKSGVGYLVERTDAIVVPVAVVDAFNIDLADFLLMRRKVRVLFGKPVTAQELLAGETDDLDKYKTISEKIMRRVARLVDEWNLPRILEPVSVPVESQ